MREEDARAKLLRMRSQIEVHKDTPGCETCFHFKRPRWTFEKAQCHHPVYCEVVPDFAKGGVDLVSLNVTVDRARSEHEACGPTAKLYERARFGRVKKFYHEIDWFKVLGAVYIIAMSVMVFRRLAIFAIPVLLGVYFLFIGGILKRRKN
jgi:hypothetical protein